MVAPAVALRNFIKTYWVLSSYDGLQHVQHIVPNGCAGIIFYRLGVVSMSGAGEANAALAGTTMQPIEILRKGQAEMIGVQFSEFGLRVLLGFPADEVYQKVSRFDAFSDKGLMELEDRIMTAASVPQCFTLAILFPETACKNQNESIQLTENQFSIEKHQGLPRIIQHERLCFGSLCKSTAINKNF